MSDRIVAVERFIPAAPQAIFDVLADPSRHPEIDGSGSVGGDPNAPLRGPAQAARSMPVRTTSAARDRIGFLRTLCAC